MPRPLRHTATSSPTSKVLIGRGRVSREPLRIRLSLGETLSCLAICWWTTLARLRTQQPSTTVRPRRRRRFVSLHARLFSSTSIYIMYHHHVLESHLKPKSSSCCMFSGVSLIWESLSFGSSCRTSSIYCTILQATDFHHFSFASHYNDQPSPCISSVLQTARQTSSAQTGST